MANRPAKDDFLQNFRFYVSVVAGTDGLTPHTQGEEELPPVGGFQSCTMPDLTVEITEYREGIMKYTKKFPGIPTVSDCSLMRGLVSNDTSFFQWMMQTISGGDYRANIRIEQHSRTDWGQGRGPYEFADPDDPGEFKTGAVPRASRMVTCFECIPTRMKPGSDLDATSGEVSMKEVDFALEWFEVSGLPTVPPNAVPGSPADRVGGRGPLRTVGDISGLLDGAQPFPTGPGF